MPTHKNFLSLSLAVLVLTLACSEPAELGEAQRASAATIDIADSSDGDDCSQALDGDGDGLIGCADPDCWGYCTPECPPGAVCSPTAARCGDGACNPSLENGQLCPADCN